MIILTFYNSNLFQMQEQTLAGHTNWQTDLDSKLGKMVMIIRPALAQSTCSKQWVSSGVATSSETVSRYKDPTNIANRFCPQVTQVVPVSQAQPTHQGHKEGGGDWYSQISNTSEILTLEKIIWDKNSPVTRSHFNIWFGIQIAQWLARFRKVQHSCV